MVRVTAVEIVCAYAPKDPAITTQASGSCGTSGGQSTHACEARAQICGMKPYACLSRGCNLNDRDLEDRWRIASRPLLQNMYRISSAQAHCIVYAFVLDGAPDGVCR